MGPSSGEPRLMCNFTEVQPNRRAIPAPQIAAHLDAYLDHLRETYPERYPRSARDYLEDWLRRIAHIFASIIPSGCAESTRATHSWRTGTSGPKTQWYPRATTRPANPRATRTGTLRRPLQRPPRRPRASGAGEGEVSAGAESRFSTASLSL